MFILQRGTYVNPAMLVVILCGAGCNIRKFNALLAKCIAVIFACQHKGAIIPLHSAILSDFLVEAQSVY